MIAIKKKARSVTRELCQHQFWKEVRCELLGTLLYVFLGCGAMTSVHRESVLPGDGAKSWDEVTDLTSVSPSASVPPPDHTQYPASAQLTISLAFGLASATLIQCLGHISGGHLNPAVSLAMLVTRHISGLRCAVYIAAQCVGGVCGAAILYGVTSGERDHHYTLGTVSIGGHVTLTQAFGVEFMIAFVVVLTVFANMEHRRSDLGSPALSIGLAVLSTHLFALGYTGAGLNPARCLGPALVTGRWRHQWIYWLGACTGGILAGFTYEYTQPSTAAMSSGEPCHLKRSFHTLSHLAPETSVPGGLMDAGGGYMRRSLSMRSSNTASTMDMTLAAESMDDIQV